MNYNKVYDNLIKSRVELKENRKILKKNCYFEKHHIIPKSLGGTNNNENIVLLTAREHFIAHWLLWRIYRNRSMALAFHKMMSNNKNQNRYYNSKAYEEARESFSKTQKGNKYNLGKTRIISEKQKENLRILMKGKFKGKDNPFYGKKHTIISKNIIKEKAKIRLSNPKNNPNFKGIKVIYKNNIELARFETTEECAKFIKGTIHGVKNVLSGNQKTTRGYFIKYSTDNKLNTVLQIK